jgi:hypothetical protein
LKIYFRPNREFARDLQVGGNVSWCNIKPAVDTVPYDGRGNIKSTALLLASSVALVLSCATLVFVKYSGREAGQEGHKVGVPRRHS